MQYLLYRLLYKQYFINTEGIKKFSERCTNKYIGTAAARKTTILTTYIQVLNKEREKRKQEFLECVDLDRMDDGSFAIRRRKSRRMKIVVYVTLLFEIFLNYISTLIFIQGEGLLYILVRWGLSIILALAAMLVTDGILTKLLPEESVRVKGNSSRHEDDESYNRNAKTKRYIGLVILPILLVAVEIAIIGVSRERAIDIEGGRSGNILFYGFILLSMALPVIAGYFKWDSEQHGKLFQNTLNYYRAEKLLHILNLIVIANMKDVKEIVDNSIRMSWEKFSRFKLYKENYNIKKSIPREEHNEDLETYKENALEHFGTEVKYILEALEPQKKNDPEPVVLIH
ncbi:MAG TPA: hypothetical protein VIN08_16745 [Ohtaekwangia sp.]|uniref:hypothetical protein n=1 Tax=Ohtaekwangia sp. TaxID=2066019 RepID=UPI002F95ECEB